MARGSRCCRRLLVLLVLLLLLLAGPGKSRLLFLNPSMKWLGLAVAPPAPSAVQCGMRCLALAECNGVVYEAPRVCWLAAVPPPACLADWTAHLDSCYRLLNTSRLWADAEASCVAAAPGAHLASIGSQEENLWLVQMGGTFTGLQIGLGHLPEYGTDSVTGLPLFRWTDGTPLNFTAWYTNQPNERADQILGCNLGIAVQRWNDATLRYAIPYVCEYDPLQWYK